MIIFLDFDGVLVTGRVNKPGDKPKKSGSWNVDPDAVEALNYLLSKFEDPKIVVSSSWRVEGLEKVRKYLKEWGVKGDVIGITPMAGFTGNRSHEINLWIVDNGYTGDFIAIDDENFDMMHVMPNKFLHVSNGWENAGLTKKMVDNFFYWSTKDDA